MSVDLVMQWLATSAAVWAFMEALRFYFRFHAMADRLIRVEELVLSLFEEPEGDEDGVDDER
jgi:hypothetical protein